MDPWGSLTMLIKKQEAVKNRKAAFKYELQKRRETLLKGSSQKEMQFPEISKAEMEILKEEIRRKYKVERIKNILVYVLIFAFLSFLVYFVLGNTKWDFINNN